LLSKKRRKVSRISEPVGMHLHFTLFFFCENRPGCVLVVTLRMPL
jgi:hypothetical protein